MCDKNENCCERPNLKKPVTDRNFKQKFQKDLCSKCPKKLDVRVGTNGRYCFECYKLYCTQKMRKAMSKSSGVDMREEHTAVILVKSLESISSVSLQPGFELVYLKRNLTNTGIWSLGISPFG